MTPTTLRRMDRAEQVDSLAAAAARALDRDRPDVAITELVGAVKVAYGLGDLPFELGRRLDELARAHGGAW